MTVRELVESKLFEEEDTVSDVESKINQFIIDLIDGRNDYKRISFEMVKDNGNSLRFQVNPSFVGDNIVYFDGESMGLYQFLDTIDCTNIASLYYYSIEADKFVDTGIKF